MIAGRQTEMGIFPYYYYRYNGQVCPEVDMTTF
jgi:hypothetical protein